MTQDLVVTEANIGSPVLIGTVSFALALGTITTLHIVLGELAPKSIAIRKGSAHDLVG